MVRKPATRVWAGKTQPIAWFYRVESLSPRGIRRAQRHLTVAQPVPDIADGCGIRVQYNFIYTVKLVALTVALQKPRARVHLRCLGWTHQLVH